MPFLNINGFRVKVEIMSPRRKLTPVGKRTRSFRRAMRNAQRGWRAAWDITAVVEHYEEAEALRRLVNGEGHMLDMATGMEAGTSLKPLAGTVPAGVQVNSQAWGPHGRGVLLVPSSVTGPVARYDAQLQDDCWTVLWRQLDGIGLWHGYAKRSDGVGYVEGTRDDTAGEPAINGFFPRVVDGVCELWKDALTSLNIDDVVILPYRAGLRMMEEWSEIANGKWGNAPVLRCSGDAFRDGRSFYALGEAKDTVLGSLVNYDENNDWDNAAKVVQFTLIELEESFLPASLIGNDTTPEPPGAPAFWFDAQDVDGNLNAGIADGIAMATWMDKGSRGLDATQGTGANQPIFRRSAESGRLEFSSSVQFDGVNDKMSTGGGTAIATPVVAAVFRSEAVDAVTRWLYDAAPVGGRVMFGRITAVPQLFAGSTVAHPTGTLLAGQWGFTIARYAGASTSWRFNDEADAVVNPGANGGLTAMVLGGLQASSLQAWEGHLVELLVWEDASYGTFDDIEAYLEARYGVLPQT